MLKHIPPILPPELLKILCEMGHGDTVVLADGNFPAESVGKQAKVVRMDGHGVSRILEAVLELFPLDQYVKHPVLLMDRVPGDTADISLWKTYEEIVRRYEPEREDLIDKKERFDFYKEAQKAYAIVATGEIRQYANIILQKGCITV